MRLLLSLALVAFSHLLVAQEGSLLSPRSSTPGGSRRSVGGLLQSPSEVANQSQDHFRSFLEKKDFLPAYELFSRRVGFAKPFDDSKRLALGEVVACLGAERSPCVVEGAFRFLEELESRDVENLLKSEKLPFSPEVVSLMRWLQAKGELPVVIPVQGPFRHLPSLCKSPRAAEVQEKIIGRVLEHYLRFGEYAKLEAPRKIKLLEELASDSYRPTAPDLDAILDLPSGALETLVKGNPTSLPGQKIFWIQMAYEERFKVKAELGVYAKSTSAVFNDVLLHQREYRKSQAAGQIWVGLPPAVMAWARQRLRVQAVPLADETALRTWLESRRKMDQIPEAVFHDLLETLRALADIQASAPETTPGLWFDIAAHLSDLLSGIAEQPPLGMLGHSAFERKFQSFRENYAPVNSLTSAFRRAEYVPEAKEAFIRRHDYAEAFTFRHLGLSGEALVSFFDNWPSEEVRQWKRLSDQLDSMSLSEMKAAQRAVSVEITSNLVRAYEKSKTSGEGLIHSHLPGSHAYLEKIEAVLVTAANAMGEKKIELNSPFKSARPSDEDLTPIRQRLAERLEGMSELAKAARKLELPNSRDPIAYFNLPGESGAATAARKFFVKKGQTFTWWESRDAAELLGSAVDKKDQGFAVRLAVYLSRLSSLSHYSDHTIYIKGDPEQNLKLGKSAEDIWSNLKYFHGKEKRLSNTVFVFRHVDSH